MSKRGRYALAAVGGALLAGALLILASRRYVETTGAQLDGLVGEGASPASPSARFAFDALGGLSTHALRSNAAPWKLIVAALLTRRPDLLNGKPVAAAARNALREFGFFTPDTILNWAGPQPAPRFEKPLGVLSGTLRLPLPGLELEVANVGCAACHAGVTYDSAGAPIASAWLGTPNTSVDFERYISAVYEGLGIMAARPGGIPAAVTRLFPTTSAAERRALRFLIAPRVTRRLREIASTGVAPLPFSNGSPGLTNGVGSLKFQAGLLVAKPPAPEIGFTSIPDLGFRQFRTSLLYDGAYAPPGAPRLSERLASPSQLRELAAIAAFFTVPAFGVSPDRAEAAIASIAEILEHLRSYRPPRFPGKRDSLLARAGRDLFAARCSECHGSYDADLLRPQLLRFPNRHVEQQSMGTDPARWQSIDDRLLDYIADSRAWSAHVVAKRTGGYVAPILSGLWITAPYLHNGSVPTLAHLLDLESRPVQFYTGGHRLRFDLVGIDGWLDSSGIWRYPEGYTPWAGAVLYDTRQPGRSNAGHSPQFSGLTRPERLALIEYLKGL